MNLTFASRPCLAAALVLFGLGASLTPAVAAPADHPDLQVLTRGPVHEAFAPLIAFDHAAGTVIANSPPDAINELPPDQRPAGADVAWIPGYWAWDDEDEGFLWVSGVWRFLPPGRQWIAGYWGECEGGYHWSSGYWADGEAEEAIYLPQPPAMTQVEPVGEAAADGQSWIPGVPVWNQGAYVDRPGYWAAMQPNWQWTPAYYVQTPRGYVFVDGYWDYPVDSRGVLYAPVSFSNAAYSQSGFAFSPSFAIAPGALIANLFLRPTFGHYYFGDYYAANYGGMGFYPAYAYHNQQGYDPFYAQQSWLNRQHANWRQQNETEFLNRRNDEAARPPRTLVAQNERLTQGSPGNDSLLLATPVDKLMATHDKPLRLEPVSASERRQLAQNSTAIDKSRAERRRSEVRAETAAGKSVPTTEKRPVSPIVAKSRDQLEAGQTPPKSLETPPSESQPVDDAEPQPATTSTPKPKRKAGLNPTAPGEPDPEVKPAPKVEPKPALKPEPKPKPQPERKARPNPPSQRDPKPAAKPAPKVETKPEVKPEPKPTPKPGRKAGPDPSSQSGPKPAAKPASKVEPKPEVKPEPKPTPKPGRKAGPDPASQVEPKPAVKPAPKVDPQPAAKPKPGATRKPAPKADPKPAAKPDPKSEPKSDAKSASRPESKPASKS